jgi:hypothetical protein
MNIIKLKDVLMPKSFKMAEFFNKNLKGKYAYWIKMRYIFPLDSLDYKSYIQYEQYDTYKFSENDILPHIDLYGEDCCMMDFAKTYIDVDATETANSTIKYNISNSYVTDFDIDISYIRKFRTWLATELLKFNTDNTGNYIGNYTESQVYMLEYYRNGMYNEIIKQLSLLGSKELIVSETNKSGCSCCNSNLSSLYNLSTIGSCDALTIYKDNLHAVMVDMFSNLNFWKDLNSDFLKLFKKYIDNIINAKFVILISNNKNPYTDCNCNYNDSSKLNESILQRLSISLEYIITGDITGHINYINDALYDWAEYLYDNMYWEINK